MDTGRLEAFSDGVMAVAITLLVLNLAIGGPGHGSLTHQLYEKRWAFAAFGVSFFTVGIIWVNHHNLFRNITEVDRTMLFANLLLLLFVVLIPFVTATLALYLPSADKGRSVNLAAVLYCVVMEGMAVSFSTIFLRAMRRRLFIVPVPPAEARSAVLRFAVGSFVYLLAIVVAVFSAPVALLLSLLADLYYVFERTGGPVADPATGPGTVNPPPTRAGGPTGPSGGR
jgi:uncharacterized membrane protein